MARRLGVGRGSRIGRLTGFVAALLLSVAALGQPALAAVVAPADECCSVAPSGLAGSGPRPGVLSASPGSRSVAQINRHPGGVEYVFDPDSGVFALGSRATSSYRGGLSPHEQLADAIGANSRTVVGGVARRGDDGLLYFDEMSGHYWQNWTNDARASFLDALDSYGIRHGGFG